MPAFMVAAAARDTDDDLGDGDGVSRRSSSGFPKFRGWVAASEGEREGGREFKSGAIPTVRVGVSRQGRERDEKEKEKDSSRAGTDVQ